MNLLAPSLLAADFSKLGCELKALEAAGADYAHIDVCDGHFVANITMGPPIIKSLRKCSRLLFDVHLMIKKPEKHLAAFCDAGADIISFHMEATDNPLGLINRIRALGMKPGIAISPNTNPRALLPFLPEIDMTLIMSVNPGFGGQAFIPEMLEKARFLRSYINKNNLPCNIQMDGGITRKNLAEVLAFGVNIVVAGTDIFSAINKEERIKEYLEIMKR